MVNELKRHMYEILIRWPSKDIGSIDEHFLHSYDGIKRREINLDFGN